MRQHFGDAILEWEEQNHSPDLTCVSMRFSQEDKSQRLILFITNMSSNWHYNRTATIISSKIRLIFCSFNSMSRNMYLLLFWGAELKGSKVPLTFYCQFLNLVSLFHFLIGCYWRLKLTASRKKNLVKRFAVLYTDSRCLLIAVLFALVGYLLEGWWLFPQEMEVGGCASPIVFLCETQRDFHCFYMQQEKI